MDARAEDAELTGLEPISCLDQSRDPADFAARLGASFQRHGFAVLSDHGLDAERTEAALQCARAFFALPEALKRRYVVQGGAGQRGYTPFAVETAKGGRHADLKEFWHVGQSDNVWPSEIAGFRRESLWLYRALERLGIRIMHAIAECLDQPPRAFEESVTGGDSILRLLHYPPTDFDGPAIRAGAHEDINAITLLLGAEEAGLEIRDRQGRWLAINPPPGAVVVNIGDMLSRLTDGVLPSTTHRVVNPAPERQGASRYSMPFFLHFRPEFVIDAPGAPAGLGAPQTTAADYLAERLREIGLRL